MFDKGAYCAVVLALIGTSIGSAQRLVKPFALISESIIGIDIKNKPVAKWSGGALLVLANEDSATPAISSLDRQGQVQRVTTFSIPGATLIGIRDFSGGVDGTIALSGSAADSSGRAASFVAWIPAEGRSTQIVRTGAYHPFRVTVALDGTVWTAGYEELVPRPPKADKMAKTLNLQAAVFRRFERSGKEIGAFVAQSEFNDPMSLRSGMSVFGSEGERIVWYSARDRQYLELSASGVVSRITGLSLPNGGRENGFALTETGDLFISSIGKSGWALYKLDRTGGAWLEIAGGPVGDAGRANPPITLYGADANLLVGATDAVKLKFFSTGTN